MILTDNVKVLEPRFSNVVTIMKAIQRLVDEFPAQVVPAKSGLPTLALEVDGRKQYIHSQYDPIAEANNIISKYEAEISKYSHVFFYGIGMGYHVEAFLDKFKDIPVTLYEPQIVFANHWLTHRSVKNWDLSRIQNIILQANEGVVSHHIEQFLSSLKGEVLIITLPSYERYFAEASNDFVKKFKDAVVSMRGNIGVSFAFEKLWVLNSANNFKHVLNSPNVFDYAEHFRSKPALLVAAGPSLEEEIERIKQIAEEKKAFIFAVGSANKVLLSHNIVPDALCTYDPNPFNKHVYAEIIENNIDSIPLIYGSSVYYEVPEQYPGPKLHMITNQDSVSNYYLQNESIFKEKLIVHDAPSIAVVTLEMLYKLGCSPIILVGQNLSIRNNQFYSKGIDYDVRGTSITEAEKQQYIWIKSVDGEEIPTFRNFDMMRRQMERLIEFYKDKSVINTTQGGAHIEGAVFTPLSEVMQQLSPLTAESKNWLTPVSRKYDQQAVNKYIKSMERELVVVKRLFQEALDLLKRFDGIVKSGNGGIAYGLFPKWDKVISKIIANEYYKVYIQPMNRVHFDLLLKSASEVKECNDPVKKSSLLLEGFGKYLYECLAHMEYCELFSREVSKSMEG